MPGVLNPNPANREPSADLEVQTEEEAIALALAMCPDGEWIEIHAAECPIRPCKCSPRIIYPERA